MFSDCNSSRISSVDSYGIVKDDVVVVSEKSNGIDDLVTELSESLSESMESFTSYVQSLSSSDSELVAKLKEQLTSKTKSDKDIKASCTNSDVALPANTPKPRRTRSPMGTYIPPPGGLPLTRSYFSSPGPGPGAYYPNISVVKYNAPQYLLKFRNKIKQEEHPGPGPGSYMITKQRCPHKYIERHFAKRFQKIVSAGPGPASCDLNEYNGIGRFKPKALILSRRAVKTCSKDGGAFENIYGKTRFGPIHSPFPILLGKPTLISNEEPGPGHHNPVGELPDHRIPITLKGRWKNLDIDKSIPGPQYMPPHTLNGPAWSLQGKLKKNPTLSDSPGPIYKPMTERKKPVTMTFRPFPVRGKEVEPGPLNYGRVGEQALESKCSNAPKALIVSRRNPDFGQLRIPGPNHYFPPSKVGFSSYNEISMKGRWKFVSSVSPGPGAYKIPENKRRSPNCVFTGKYQPKPPEERSPGFVYTPRVDKGTIRNILMLPRWKTLKKASDSVKFYDLTGFTQRGKLNRMGISLKSRHTPFVYNCTSTNPVVPAVDRCNIQGLKFESNQMPVINLPPTTNAIC